MQIDRGFAQRIKSLDWAELQFGLTNNLLAPGVAVDRAIRALGEGQKAPEILELAKLSYHDLSAIRDRVASLASDIDPLSKEKWQKILMAWVYEHRDLFIDPAHELELLYADFSVAEPRSDQDWKDYLNREVYGSLVEPMPV